MLLSFCLIFYQFQRGVAYKCVYKKSLLSFYFPLEESWYLQKEFYQLYGCWQQRGCCKNILIYQKREFGTGVWYRCLVQVIGTGVWYRCLVQVFGTGVWYRCFPVNFVKFLWSLFFAAHLRWLLLFINSFGSFRMYIITFATYCSLLFRRCSH